MFVRRPLPVVKVLEQVNQVGNRLKKLVKYIAFVVILCHFHELIQEVNVSA